MKNPRSEIDTQSPLRLAQMLGEVNQNTSPPGGGKIPGYLYSPAGREILLEGSNVLELRSQEPDGIEGGHKGLKGYAN
jgi:hypothetical protein